MRGRKSVEAHRVPPTIRGMKEPSLILDARNGDLSQMKKKMRNSFFKKLEDVNQKDERDCRPLHYASKNSHLLMIRFLIDKGADLKALDKHGWSVLQYAVRYGTLQAVQLLIDLGADLHHRENKGWNCLHLAARNGHPEKARLLLENGIDVAQTQYQGWNALHLAVRYGQPDTISTLLEYGIDMNADNRGWTALHLASLNGHTDITSILLNKGASTLIQNDDGHTALQIARRESHQRIVAMILEAEFQGREPPALPSPPPTPPTAPAFETLSSSGGDNESISEWKDRIRKQLDSVDYFVIDQSDEDFTSKEISESSPSDGTIKIQWKSLKEEESELMRQLENVCLREVNQIKFSIIRKKREYSKQIVKFDKRRELLRLTIDQLEKDIPDIDVSYRERIFETERSIDEIDEIRLRNEREADLINQLKFSRQDLAAPSSISSILNRKNAVINELLSSQVDEFNLLNAEKSRLLDQIENLKSKIHTDVQLVRDKIDILKKEIINDTKAQEKYIREFEAEVELSRSRLDSAERRAFRHKERTGEVRDWFGCPVCLCLLKPPMRIFQCPEGHILCEECKENPALVHCPQCRIPLEGLCSRNRALEEVARSYFPLDPSETL